MTELPGWLTAWLGWIEAHPGWSLLLLALASGIEGLFLVGLLIPGSVLMFAAGVLAATGVLHPVAALASATMGAFAGDALSYSIGRTWRSDLPRLTGNWNVLPRAESFFRQHGGVSILLGRLIGPLRPFVPAVAGAAGYPVFRYLLMAALSCSLWALAYGMPGMLVGATMQVLAEVLGRISLLLGAFLLTLYLIYRALVGLIGAGQLYAEPILLRLIDWSHRHRRLGRLGPALADRDQPESPVLLVCLLILLIVGLVVETILRGFSGDTGIASWNLTVLDQFASLRGGTLDIGLAWLRSMTDAVMLMAMTGAAAMSFYVARRHREAAHLLAGMAGSVVLFASLETWVREPPALLPMYYARFGPFTELGTAACLGFLLAGLLATHRSRSVRLALYWSQATLTIIAGITTLLLGEILPDRGLLLLALAILWSSLVTLGFRRHQRRPQPGAVIPVLVALITCVILLPPNRSLPQTPSRSEDLVMTRPDRINLSWTGDPSTVLSANGWVTVKGWEWAHLRSWLSDDELAAQPAVPVLLNGTPPTQVWQRGEQIIRLWPSTRNNLSEHPPHPEFVGHFGLIRETIILGVLHLPLTKIANWRRTRPESIDLPPFLDYRLDPASHLLQVTSSPPLI